MQAHQIELLDSMRGLMRAGGAQTGASINLTEGTSSGGWLHASIAIHHQGEMLTWYAMASPDGNDYPGATDTHYVTLSEMHEALIEWIVTHRKQDAA